MQFLVIFKIKAGVTPEQLSPLIKSEVAKVWEMHLSGHLRSAHLIHDNGGVTMMFEAEDREEVERLLHELPMIRQDLFGYEILPLAPFTGFSVLFA